MVPRKSSKRLRNREIAWEVIWLKGSPALFMGVVHAPDEKRTRARTIKQVKIPPVPHDRLLIRPWA